jgi:hypothetical protein
MKAGAAGLRRRLKKKQKLNHLVLGGEGQVLQAQGVEDQQQEEEDDEELLLKGAPADVVCPISFKLMNDPVNVFDGWVSQSASLASHADDRSVCPWPLLHAWPP